MDDFKGIASAFCIVAGVIAMWLAGRRSRKAEQKKAEDAAAANQPGGETSASTPAEKSASN